MKISKKILSVILTLMTVILFTACNNNFEYVFSEGLGGIQIYKYNGDNSVVEIPEEIGGKKVVKIDGKVFAGCTELTSITIPNSVRIIGDAAFHKCTGLISITIPNSVTMIGSSAFYGCTGLTNITISKNINTIGLFVFKGCTGLTSITIPESVTEIGNSAFYGCTGLTSITIPYSVTYIGEQAFYGCTATITYKGKTYTPKDNDYEELYKAINSN